jgi:hypothetical protein
VSAREIQPRAECAKLLKRYSALGGVIEHIFVAPCSAGDADEGAHRAAALLTLDTLRRRLDSYFERLLQSADYRKRKRDEFFAIKIEPARLTGKRITVDEFLGPWWNRAKCNFGARDEMCGYAYAFFDPPYCLSYRSSGKACTDQSAAELFRTCTDECFAGFADQLVVFEWSGDCSNYFDAGNEWWGSFFWTVQVPGRDHLLGVAASTTD